MNFDGDLEVELEHGLRFKAANVTNNHPILTGKIVLAHLKESSYYYKLLEVAELEGDLMKTNMDNQVPELKNPYLRLAHARMILRQAEIERLDRSWRFGFKTKIIRDRHYFRTSTGKVSP